ncbi:hypothetical protein GpartN1_g2065.t1 [Galdieria partita]|uniref:RING-type domain-containing protein n=1 Tax=Galdieria partita TaxID=83374 RepID=A0A9C7PTQ8_9RHOD|nr:hypothetical protein GpartN1_g2065.t1 [Galdieria partita]
MNKCLKFYSREERQQKWLLVLLICVLLFEFIGKGSALVVLHPLGPDGSAVVYRHIMAVFGATRGLGFKGYSFVGNVTYYDKNPCAPFKDLDFGGNFVLFDVSKATANYSTCSFTELAFEVQNRNGAGMLVFDEEDKLYIMSSSAGIYGTRHSINIPCAWTELGLATFIQNANAKGDYVQIVLNATADVFLDGNLSGGMFDSVIDLFKSGLIGVMTASSLIMLVRLFQVLFAWCRDIHGRYLRRRRLRGIPVKHYSMPRDSVEPDVCAICLDPFSEGENINELPCNHLFHRACIWKWLESSPLCPICKQNVFPDASLSEEGLYEPQSDGTSGDTSFAWWSNHNGNSNAGASSYRDRDIPSVSPSGNDLEEISLDSSDPRVHSDVVHVPESRQTNEDSDHHTIEVVVDDQDTRNESTRDTAMLWLSSLRNLGRVARFRLMDRN